jgi:branched-chain amino acid transport system permease protein
MKARFRPRDVVVAVVLAGIALLPLHAALTGNSFLMSLCTRIIILAMAAVSLNLIMGFGGMVSFGHAAYLGIGGYVVGILAKEGVFHHDHPRLHADALLRGDRPRPLRRR